MDDSEVLRRPPFGANPVVGERGTVTQRRILDASLTVFGEHGYHDTRVELIAEAAGTSRPSFYQYFSSKEDVFWALARQMGDAMGLVAQELGEVEADRAGSTQLREWLDGLVDLCSTYAPLLAGFQAAKQDQAPRAAGSQAVSEQLGQALLRSFDGDSNVIDMTSLSTITSSVVLRSTFYWALGLGELDRGSFVDGLAQTVHRLLHGMRPGVNADAPDGAPPGPVPEWPNPPTRTVERSLRPRGQQTRKRLLDAASAQLPVHGYDNLRIDDIVEAAGVSHGSFYRYFESKDAVFQVLAVDAARRMVDLLAVFPGSPTESTLLSWLRKWFASYRDNGGIISAWQEIGSEDPQLAAFSLEVAVAVFSHLVRIVDRRGFGDPTVDAIVLLSVIERSPNSVLVLGYLDEPQAIDASALIIRRGLFGSDTPAR